MTRDEAKEMAEDAARTMLAALREALPFIETDHPYGVEVHARVRAAIAQARAAGIKENKA